MAGQVDTSTGQHVDAVGARRLTVESQTSRADVHVDPPPFEPVSEKRLGHGRAADVAGAQEEDLDGPTVGPGDRVATLPPQWLLTLERLLWSASRRPCDGPIPRRPRTRST